jgi:hypothetical protein
MSKPRQGEAQVARASDPLFWGLAALLTFGALALPRFLNLQGDWLTEVLMTESALFTMGAALGCFRRQRPWRWAVASFLALALRDVILTIGTTGLNSADVPAIAVLLIGHCGMYFLQVLPVLVGSLLGASIMGAGLDT